MTVLRLRRDVAEVVGYASGDLAALWSQVRTAAELEVALRDILPTLVETYGAAAATLAAEWYEDMRAKAGVAGVFSAIAADPGDGGTQALIGWALAEANDLPGFQQLILGGAQRRIAAYSRQTIATSSIADPGATGWQRIGVGDTCTWCRMVNARGAVFTEATATFAAHDNDDCQAVPAWGGQPVPVKPYTVSPRRTIDPQTGKPVIDADFLRAKKWLEEHPV